MIGIDLFAGAGGMSLGALAAGIDLRIAVEANPYAAMSYAYNHRNVRLLVQDIRRLRMSDLDLDGNGLIVFGGPPCKGFSTSNQRTRTRTNPSNWLFKEFLRVVRGVNPDWVVFENVQGIQQTEGGEFLDELITSLTTYGYSISLGILNASDFGVPQIRSRLFVVGNRHGIKVNLPTPIARRQITVLEAIGDLPVLVNGASVCRMVYRAVRPSPYARAMRGTMKDSHNHLVTRNADHIIERYKHVPPGGNWKDIPSRLMKTYKNRTECHTGIYHRLHPQCASKVIGNYRKNMLIHPLENRGLSVREAARIQSFPDWFEFKGSIGFQQEQVGSAVPPLLAKAVFDLIVKAACP
jgi:DNA (cytosine-5)-methyltransferase 1